MLDTSIIAALSLFDPAQLPIGSRQSCDDHFGHPPRRSDRLNGQFCDEPRRGRPGRNCDRLTGAKLRWARVAASRLGGVRATATRFPDAVTPGGGSESHRVSGREWRMLPRQHFPLTTVDVPPPAPERRDQRRRGAPGPIDMPRLRARHDSVRQWLGLVLGTPVAWAALGSSVGCAWLLWSFAADVVVVAALLASLSARTLAQ